MFFDCLLNVCISSDKENPALGSNYYERNRTYSIEKYFGKKSNSRKFLFSLALTMNQKTVDKTSTVEDITGKIDQNKGCYHSKNAKKHVETGVI